MAESIVANFIISLFFTLTALLLIYLWWDEKKKQQRFLLTLSSSLLLLALSTIYNETTWPLRIFGSALLLVGILQSVEYFQRENLKYELTSRRAEELEQITDTINYLMLTLDKEGQIINVGDYALEKSGYTREELLNTSLFDLIPSENKMFLQLKWIAISQRGEFEEFETKILTKKEEPLGILIKKAIVRDNNITLICEDISSKKHESRKKEATLSQSRQVFNSLPDATYIIGLDGTILSVNNAASLQIGMPTQALKNYKLQELLPLELYKKIKQLPDTGDTVKAKGFSRRADGTGFPAEITAGIVNTNKMLVVVKDTTEQETQLNTITNLNTNLARCNQALAKISETRSLKNIYKTLLDSVSEAFDTPYVAGCVKREDGLYKSMFSTQFNITGQIVLPKPLDICDTAIKTREVQVMTDYNKETTITIPYFIKQMGFVSAMSAPLISGASVIGSVKILTTEQRTFTGEDKTLIKKIGEHAANKIVLLQKIEKTNNTIEKLQNLQDINKQILDMENFSELLERFPAMLVQQLSIEAAYIKFHTHPQLTASAGLDESPPLQGIAELANTTGQPHTWQYIDTNPTYKKWQEEAASHNYCSATAIPITKPPGGILLLYSQKPEDFPEEITTPLTNLVENLATIKTLRENIEKKELFVKKAQNNISIINRLLSHTRPIEIYTTFLKQITATLKSNSAALFIKDTPIPTATIGTKHDWAKLEQSAGKLLHIPLAHHREQIGHISIPYIKPFTLVATSEAEQLCQLLTPLIANTLQLQKTLEQAKLIHAFDRSNWCMLNRKEKNTLECLLSSLRELLGANSAAIIANTQTEDVRIHHAITYEDPLKQLLLNPQVQSHLSSIKKTTSLQNINNITQVKTQLNSLIVTPLLTDNLEGFLCCAANQAHMFTQVDEDIIAYIAGNVASQLEIREHRKTIQRFENQLKTMQEINIDMASSLELETIMSRILSSAIKLTKADSGIIALMENNALTHVKIQNLPEDITGTKTLLENPIAEDTQQLKRPLLTEDYPANPESNPILVESGVKTMIAAPLTLQNKVIGVIKMFRKTPEKFTTPDLETLANITPHATLGILKAKQYNELKNMEQHMEEQIAEKTEELRTTHRALLNLLEDLQEETHDHL